jgi:hypothetical protein
MKHLYFVATQSDGYVSIHYTLDKDVADKFAEDQEGEGDVSEVESVIIPDECTYETLGITYPIEHDWNE